LAIKPIKPIFCS